VWKGVSGSCGTWNITMRTKRRLCMASYIPDVAVLVSQLIERLRSPRGSQSDGAGSAEEPCNVGLAAGVGFTIASDRRRLVTCLKYCNFVVVEKVLVVTGISSNTSRFLRSQSSYHHGHSLGGRKVSEGTFWSVPTDNQVNEGWCIWDSD
jgi:hypothetical protein